MTSLAGTANEITASASTGAVTLSIPSAFVLPGTINGLTISTSTGTLAIANGKTFTASNTLTLTGTDGSSVAFGAGGTVLYANQTITLTGAVTGSGATSITTTFGSIAADNLLMNASGSSAAPAATAVGSCSTASSALTYNTSTHAFGCNSITGGTGNALFGTTSGNVTNNIVTMSNTTVGVQDSGTALSSLAPKASPTLTGTPAIAAATGASLSVTGAITDFNATAIPTGGTAGAGFLFSSTANFGVIFGTGAPTASAAEGSLYLRNDTGHPYYNANGSTTWTDLTAGGGGSGCVPSGTVNQILTDSGSGTCTSNTITITGTGGIVLNIPAGSVGTPSLEFGGDTTSGFYRPASNQVAFSSSGTEEFVFAVSDLQGITTNAPEVRNNIALGNPTLVPNKADTRAGIGANASGNISIYVDDGTFTAEAARFSNNGSNLSVVLGPYKSGGGGYTTSVQVGSSANIGTDNNTAGKNGTIASGVGTGSSTGSSLIFQTPTPVGSGTGAQTQTTQLTINNAAGATFVPTVTFADAGTWTSTGVTVPTAVTLSHNQNQATTFTISNTTTGTASETRSLYTIDSGNFIFGALSSGYTTSGAKVANHADILTLWNGGVVDIGGTVANSGIAVWDANAKVGIWGASGLTALGAVLAPNLSTSSAAQTGTLCWTTGTGNFTVDTTTTCLLSLEEYKDILPGGIPGALAETLKLKPFAFSYKKDTPEYAGDPRVHFGLGAHATEAVDPRLAGYDTKGKLRGVRYADSVTALLIASVQEQQVEIEEMKKQNTALERAVAQLSPKPLSITPISATRH